MGPGHPLNVGVTTYCTLPFTDPVLDSAWLILAPVPLDDPLTFVAVCVQLNVAPAGVDVKFRAVALPEQTDVGPVIVAVGIGLTTKLNESDMGPVQPVLTVL